MMGTFGTSITSDDTVADVIGTVVDQMKDGASLHEATDFALRRFNDSLKDADDGPLIWLALSHIQWKYGRVEAEILNHVRKDIVTERGLDRWRDDPIALEKRKRVLRSFLEKISSPNPKPADPPRHITRLAPFAEGDCLAVLTRDGDYTAAIVLMVDNSRREYGCNLVASLDYLSGTPPLQNDFDERRWLFKHHGNWNGAQELSWYMPVGFRKERKRIAIVGKTAIRPDDPQRSDSYSGWNLLGEQILLCRGKSNEA